MSGAILTRLSDQSIERFWSKVDRREPDQCWDWQASFTHGGYGNIKLCGRWAQAHRVALVIGTGEDHPELFALHSCDRPACCNPAHLRWGTHSDNVGDRITRRRTRTGNKAGFKNPMAQMSPGSLKRIVDLLPTSTNNAIANEVGISPSMVSAIRTGKSWRDEAIALGWAPPVDRKTKAILELLDALDTCLDYCMLDFAWDDPRAVKARAAIKQGQKVIRRAAR